MAQLHFKIKNQHIVRTDDFYVVAKSIGYLYAAFDFSDDWGDGAKTAQFKNSQSEDVYEVVIGQDGTCLVPWEALQYDNSVMTVTVFCGNRITANAAPVQIRKTGYSEDGESSQPPTPDVYTQIINRMDGVETEVQRAETAARGYAESAAGSATSATGSATAAAQAAESASSAAREAEEARDAAKAEADRAERATADIDGLVGRAETAAQNAETAKGAAETAQSAAEMAQSAAESARDAAGMSATNAAESAEAAATSASAAASSAGISAGAASAAGNSRDAAAQYATEASSSAEAAAGSATAAQTAQTAAETAQTAAETAQEAAEEAAGSIGQSAAQIAQNAEDITDLKSAIRKLDDRVDSVEAELEGIVPRYGVSGIGQSASALTRILDAVGMVAQVGTDGDNSDVVNDFDEAGPWMWRKCVGHWSMEDGRPKFNVHAYLGDDDYTEDGSNGDYVAVECPLSYYKMEDDRLIISKHNKYNGFRPFDIFCHDHDINDTIPYYYRPAYALVVDEDNHAVCLPGYDNEQGAYRQLTLAARTYGDGSMGTQPILYPMALSFYDWAMFTVEFATQNCQSIMQGCASLRQNDSDRITFIDSTHGIATGWYTTRVPGEYIAIVPTNVDLNLATVKATHKIVSVTRCDASGDPSASGTYTLIEMEDLGKDYYTYDYTGATEYKIAGRPYRTGECNSVGTPSGSPVSNTDGCHPMRYRYVENLYCNQYKTTADFFNKRIDDGGGIYHLEHYYLLKPQEYVPSANSKPDAADLATDKFVKLGIETDAEHYVSGYCKSKLFDEDYPDIWIPYETTGASGSTYYCDYVYLVNSSDIRVVRLFGRWLTGPSAGLSFFTGYSAPSAASPNYGGALCFAQ